MKVKIEITEGCTSYSYTINDIEWVDLVDKESDYYNLELADKVCEELLKQAQEQYQLPNWIMDYLWDGCNATCEQYTFTKLVKNNKDTKEEYLGHCGQCGDMIYRWILELDIS